MLQSLLPSGDVLLLLFFINWNFISYNKSRRGSCIILYSVPGNLFQGYHSHVAPSCDVYISNKYSYSVIHTCCSSSKRGRSHSMLSMDTYGKHGQDGDEDCRILKLKNQYEVLLSFLLFFFQEILL